MSRRLAIAMLTTLMAVATTVSPARADIEYGTIRCDGTILDYQQTAPGSREWVGGLSCVLGRGSETGGVEEYASFTSSLTADAGITELAPQVYWFNVFVHFSDGRRNYVLHFEDPSVADDLAMTNEYDEVDFGHPDYAYHVRAGYLTSNPCVGCTPIGYCDLGDCIMRSISFVAEYLYDIPVSGG